MVVLGNISIDIYFKSSSLTYFNDRFQLAIGGKYFAENVHVSVGGSGANISIGLSKNGVIASVVGTLGQNPFKQIILEELRRRGVHAGWCQVIENYHNISTILLASKGERTIIHYTSPHQHIFSRTSDYHILEQSDAVFFGNHPDVSLDEKIQIFKFLKEHHIMSFLNIGVLDCRRKKETLLPLLRKANIIIINGHEFADLVKAQYSDIHFGDDILNWYAPELKDQVVVVTDGAKGSYAYYQGTVYHQTAVKPHTIVDTTGAGDAFSAGFIAEYIRSFDIKKSLEKGSHYASKILSKIGAN